MQIISYLIIAALVATVIVLVLGLRSMAKGGQYDREHAEKFMWERVALQALVVILLIAAAILAIGDNPPDDVNVIIEVPVGGNPIKYELDKEAGTLVVDRFLYTPMAYPGNYGFVPHTLSEDGDPIDVLVCNTRQLVPGCVINVRPIGVLIMEDNAGQDEKVIAVPSHALTRRYDHVMNASDLPEITLQQVEHFFEHYKDLEPGKWVKIGDWLGAADARRLISEAIDRANT
jgi:inorganic pyrophosphatase